MTPDLVVDLPFIACLRLLRPGFGDGLGSDRSICQRPRVSCNRALCIESERLSTIQAGETSSLFHEVQVVCTANCRLIYVAAAQNVRSGSSPGPTNDPDLWSRPPIQTFPRELIQTFDPDLLEWYSIWASWCLQLFTLPSSQATNCFKATLPSCQAAKLYVLLIHAAKLSNCSCCQANKLSSYQAVKQSSCNCWTSKLPSCQADTVARPGCQAAKLSTCCLLTLSLLVPSLD